MLQLNSYVQFLSLDLCKESWLINLLLHDNNVYIKIGTYNFIQSLSILESIIKHSKKEEMYSYCPPKVASSQ